MTDAKQQLVELVRKVDSEFYDPKVHGQGVIVLWSRKKNECVSSQGTFDRFFSKNNIDYYFVKTSGKPIQIKKLPFKWLDGTSDISLEFEANFQIKIASRQDAEKLVVNLINQQVPSISEALYQIIDEQLHSCMVKIYTACNASSKNLLDEFYLQGVQKGENPGLDAEVAGGVNGVIKGLGFGIGFALRNIPIRVADFNHCTKLSKGPSQKEFNLQSECTLKLCSYQSYKKSGINSLDGVIAHMKSVIDLAINEHVAGKTLFDLFNNFESSEKEGKKSILKLVREQVKLEANAIGYALESFHSLPDLAPLKLLNGIRIDIDEMDTENGFSTGYGGGNIKINAGMDVKAVQGGFQKLMHLLSPSGDYENIDVLEFTYSDLVERIKKPIISICRNFIKQKDYKAASVDFDNEIKSDLEALIFKEMETLYGLKVIVKSMFAVETEDSSRLRSLSGRKQTFEFKVISHNNDKGEVLAEFKSAFRVTGIDIVSGWDAFEKADFGYRSNSPVRTEFKQLDRTDPDFDKQCKAKAIADELQDIADEIIRCFKAKLELVPNLNAWYRDWKISPKSQSELLLPHAVLAIKDHRGLLIDLEEITLDDKYLLKMVSDERDAKYKYIEATQNKKSELMLEELENSVVRERNLKEAISIGKASVISEIEDIEGLEEIEKRIPSKLDIVPEPPDSIGQLISQSTTANNQLNYNDAIDELMNKKQKKLITNDGEKDS